MGGGWGEAVFVSWGEAAPASQHPPRTMHAIVLSSSSYRLSGTLRSQPPSRGILFSRPPRVSEQKRKEEKKKKKKKKNYRISLVTAKAGVAFLFPVWPLFQAVESKLTDRLDDPHVVHAGIAPAAELAHES